MGTLHRKDRLLLFLAILAKAKMKRKMQKVIKKHVNKPPFNLLAKLRNKLQLGFPIHLILRNRKKLNLFSDRLCKKRKKMTKKLFQEVYLVLKSRRRKVKRKSKVYLVVNQQQCLVSQLQKKRKPRTNLEKRKKAKKVSQSYLHFSRKKATKSPKLKIRVRKSRKVYF